MVDDEAFVSLAINDTYATAALILGDSLKDTKTCRKSVLLVANNVTQLMRNRLSQVWDFLIDLEDVHAGGITNTCFVERPELWLTFFKLKIWTLTQFRKCVFLDADTLVLQNVDELFERDELSAAPDIGWPDCFNSGVFVFVPSIETYVALVKFAEENGSFDGNDQGVLNMYFKDWSKTTSSHLPYIYNMVSSTCYTYAPALNHYGKTVKIVHFVGSSKPWSQHYDYSQSRVCRPPSGESNGIQQQFIDIWWDRYHKLQQTIPFQQKQQNNEIFEAHEVSGNVGNSGVGVQDIVSDQQKAWERGDIDFARRDRFNVIQNYLDNVIDGKPNDEPREESHEEHVEFQNNWSENEDKGQDGNNHENEGNQSNHNQNNFEFHVNVNTFAYAAEEHFTPPPPGYEPPKEGGIRGNSLDHEIDISHSVEEQIVVKEEEIDPEHAARLRWEFGNIDFTGEDSFDRIEEYLNSLLEKMEKSLKPAKYFADATDNSPEHDMTNGDTSFILSNGSSRGSGGTSPVLSLPDSAYYDTPVQKPEKFSRSTQTSFSCISKAIQTEFEVDD